MTGDPHREGGGYGYDEGPLGAAGTGAALAPVSRWVRLAGAATSIALIVGVVVWGYKLAVRDVSGVPVIRALEGPSRIAPEDPGGELASHVGLAVNQVAGTGTAAPGPEQVLLAPDPEGLAEDDMTMAAVGPLPDPGAAPAAQMPEADAEGAATPAPVPVPDAPGAGASVPPVAAVAPDPAVLPAALPDAAKAEAEPGETAPVAAPDPTSDPAADPAADPASGAAAQTAPLVLIPDSVPGVKRSPRPFARPAGDLAAEAVAAAVAAARSGGAEGEGEASGAPVAEVDPASLPEGTRLAQIGAFESPELARAEWGRVAARFGALMEGKRRVIQQASSGGRTFYRLRVEGFADVDEARRFCAALVAEQTNCIPTLVR